MFHRMVLGILLLSIAPATYGAADDQQPIDATPTPVMTHRGVQTFHVADLDAAESPAWLHEELLSEGEGLLPEPLEGYELNNRVIVRTARDVAAGIVLGAHGGLSYAPFESVPGFWVVTAGSVGEAIELAAALSADPQIEEAYVDLRQPIVLREPNDPHYFEQWHLKNNVHEGYDVNAEPAWDAGYTGMGVVVGIIEGGWQFDHPDLAANYNEEASHEGGGATSHATSCAGVAAAVAFNNAGGVGMAYGAQVSSQRFGGALQNADAFTFRNDLNAVKSNSWGPPDNGRISYMASVERAALEEAVLTGRAGLGTIFTWAAGNGGLTDRVDYDPYASSRYTCAIGSIGDQEQRAWYNESGSSMLAVAHSSGNSRYIFTTKNNSDYTATFGGTSAASPLGAGVVALVLEANPALTWRDVQHVLINSARKCDPDHSAWTTNGAGHEINYNFGFGTLDAFAAVTLAADWICVRPEVALSSAVIAVNDEIPDGDPNGLTQVIDVAENIRVESVEVILNVATGYVGDMTIVLTAPGGTESLLAERRGDPQEDYTDYIFTSVRHWDELSAGAWTVSIVDGWTGHVGTWVDVELRIYGTRRPGDLNQDGHIDYRDVNAFVAAVWGPDWFYASYPDWDDTLADVNEDGSVDFGDINPFIGLLES